MKLIDTHAHLDEDAFAADVPVVLERAADAGLIALLTIGTTLASSRSAVALAESYPQVFAVVGIQPNYAAEAGADDWDQIVELAQHPRVVAIGETGLDRYWDFAPIDLQSKYFDLHIDLAVERGLPFVIHCRDAEADVVESLERAYQRHGPLSAIMHSFCGDTETAARCLEMGLHISFAGMLTFKRNTELRAVAATIPADRLLIETDSPYLAPIPHRGKRNEPAFVKHTLECLAEVRDESVDDLAAVTTANAIKLFRLPV